ncbi:MAG: S9 family peptidase [Arcanobacterium sp.]|nr:S9 family peptidase [Arcanobacterium sp.]
MSKMNTFPIADKRPIIRNFHGDEFIDNYEWLRNAPEAEVHALVQAENKWYEDRTEHLAAMREKLVSEMAAHTQEDDISVPVAQGDYWYWTQTWTGKSYPAMYRVSRKDYPERPDPLTLDAVKTLVYDANQLAEGLPFFAIGAMAFSQDGKYCALAIDSSGGERFQIRIHEVDTGFIVDDVVTNTSYSLAFSASGEYIYYTRADDAWRTYQMLRHRVGTNTAEDVLLFQEDDELYTIGFDASTNGEALVLGAVSTLTREFWVYDLNNVDTAPYCVSERRQGLDYTAEIGDGFLWIVHNLNSADFEVAVAPLGHSTPEEWHSVLCAETGERISGLSAFKDFAVVSMRANGSSQLVILRPETLVVDTASGVETQAGTASAINKPSQVTVEVIPSEETEAIEFAANNDWNPDELLYTVESLIKPLTVMSYDLVTAKSTQLKQTLVPGHNPEDYVEYREWATAKDGTKIPVTVVHRQDLQRDGNNPGFVYGYGSYEISMDPWFDVAGRLAIIEHGLVYAIAHVRGGGEMGRAWYEGGKFMNKPNSFSDFVSATEHLVEIGLIDRNRIAAEGRSAGGLLMGAVTNLAPDLYRVVHAGVPFVDALTTILNPDLPLTVGEWEEWGNPIESAEIYACMKSYSPYENIAAREYPAILATTSINDVRVSFLEPLKWVSQLRATVTNDPLERPIVLQTEMVAGHGGGSGRYKRWENRAHQLAFIFDQLGVTIAEG